MDEIAALDAESAEMLGNIKHALSLSNGAVLEQSRKGAAKNAAVAQIVSTNGTAMDATQVRSANGAASYQPGATPQEQCAQHAKG